MPQIRSRSVLVALAVLLNSFYGLTADAAPAPARRTVAYQGVLEENGAAVDGVRDLTFYLFDYEAPAAAPDPGWVWSEAHAAVPVVGGRFAVALGITNDLEPRLFDVGNNLYIEVEVAGVRLTGRQRLTAVPSALQGVPPGTVVSFAGASTPAGWLVADGTAVSRSEFAALFANIGTLHGSGDGTTTFNLPNLVDRFVGDLGRVEALLRRT